MELPSPNTNGKRALVETHQNQVVIRLPALMVHLSAGIAMVWSVERVILSLGNMPRFVHPIFAAMQLQERTQLDVSILMS